MGIETLEELEDARVQVERLRDYLASLPPTEDAWERHCRWATQATIFNLEEDIEGFEFRSRLKQEKLPLAVGS
nr:hypothetical protein [Armatimonas sp.]